MYTKKQFKSSLIAASLSTAFASSFAFAQDISGTVVDEQGNIVAGALIEIKGSYQKQTTDAKGNFSFSDIGLSNIELHISAPKYAHRYKQLTHTKDEDQKNITVSLSKSSIEIIDVYATPLHTSTIESAIPVNVLSGENLKRKQASSLGSTLKNEVGIHQTYYGSVTSSPIIRGLDGPRVMTTQNGLDSGDAARVGADHAVATETSTATQIEVLRGPSTLFYGSGAIGGVVNVVDNRVPKSSDTEVDWLLQHNTGASEDQGSLALQTGTENIAVHFDGFFRNADNYILPEDFVNDDEQNPENDERLPNSDTKSSGFNIGTSYLLDDGYIGFSYGYLSKDYGIPGHHHHHEEDHEEDHDEDHEAGHEEHEEGEERVAAEMEQSRYQLLSEINFQHSFIEKLATKIAYTDYQHHEIEEGQIGTTFSNESLEAKFDVTHENLAGWRGAWTVHYKYSDFEAIGEEAFTPPSETEMIALAWLEEKHFGNVLLQLGARAEHVTVSADDSYIGFHDDHKELVSFETQEFTPLSASVGLVYDYDKGYNLGLATSFSQRTPSAAELFSFGPHIGTQAFEIGAIFELEEEITPDGEEELHVELSADKPSIESSYNIDLSWRKFEGDFGFVVSAFYNRVDNFYYQEGTGHHFGEDHEEHGEEHHDEEHHDEEHHDEEHHDEEHHDEHEEAHGDEEHEDGLPILVYQQNDIEMYGLEAEFAYQITSDFSAKLFGDVIKTKLIGGEEDGNSLPRIPPMRLGTTFAYQGNSFDTDISVSHFFEQDDIAKFETSTPGYTIVDFTFNYFVNAGVFNTPGLTDTDIVVFLKGENLTDEYGMVHSSFLKETAPLMGRSFSFGIRGSF
jgi:iron complex outermembrane receptor protein